MEPTLSIFELVRQGGLAMYPLVVCSILSLAVICERAWILWKVVRPGHALTASVLARVSRADLDEARMILKTAETPVAEIFRGALLRGPNGDYGLLEMDRKRQELLHGLRRHLWILGTVGSLAPFIGLFGRSSASCAPSTTWPSPARVGLRWWRPGFPRRWWRRQPGWSWPSSP